MWVDLLDASDEELVSRISDKVRGGYGFRRDAATVCLEPDADVIDTDGRGTMVVVVRRR